MRQNCENYTQNMWHLGKYAIFMREKCGRFLLNVAMPKKFFKWLVNFIQ